MLQELQDSNLVDEEFLNYLRQAKVTRELWWIPYEVVAQMSAKEIAAYRIIAAEYEAKFFQKLALALGDEFLMTNLLCEITEGDEKEKARVNRGHIINRMNLESYKQRWIDEQYQR